MSRTIISAGAAARAAAAAATLFVLAGGACAQPAPYAPGDLQNRVIVYAGSQIQLLLSVQAQQFAATAAGALTATGTNQATAYDCDTTASCAGLMVFGTVASGTGVAISADLQLGAAVTVVNEGASPLTVYPPIGSGAAINGGAANAGITVAPQQLVTVQLAGTLDFRTLGGAGGGGSGIPATGGILCTSGTAGTAAACGAQRAAANGLAPTDANSLVPYASMPAAVQERGITLSFGGVPSASQIAQAVLPFACGIAANFGGAQSWANTAPTSSAAIALKSIHSGSATAQGNLTVAASAHTGTFPTASAISLVAGDVLQAVAPASPDATLADIAITVECLTVTP